MISVSEPKKNRQNLRSASRSFIKTSWIEAMSLSLSTLAIEEALSYKLSAELNVLPKYTCPRDDGDALQVCKAGLLVPSSAESPLNNPREWSLGDSISGTSASLSSSTDL